MTKKTEEDYLKLDDEINNAFSTLACGQWKYEGYIKDFNTAILERGLYDLPKIENMPEKLILSNKESGTDLNKIVFYRKNYLSLNNDGEYEFFFLERGRVMVVYPIKFKGRDIQPESLVYHIYKKYGNEKYTDEDVKKVIEKANAVDEFTKKEPLNAELYGHYEIYDEILESEVDTYTGKVKTEDACFILSPLFDVLDICGEGAYVLVEGEKINIKFDDEHSKTLTRENTMLYTYMHDTDKHRFGAYDPQRNTDYRFLVKVVGGKTYIFANLNGDRDKDETIYVFVKK